MTVDLPMTLLAAVLRLAGEHVSSAMVLGPDYQLGITAGTLARALSIRERVMRIRMLRWGFTWQGALGDDGQRLVCAGLQFLPVVISHMPPSSLPTTEAKRRWMGLSEVARGLMTGTRDLSDVRREFLAAIDADPVPFWLDRAHQEFPGIPLMACGHCDEPTGVPALNRARYISVLADRVPFNSAKEIEVTRAWIDAVDELERLADGAYKRDPAVLNAVVIENARFLQWAKLRGITQRRRADQM
jgi:hypothetical protein